MYKRLSSAALFISILCATSAARAQTSVIGFRAVPSATTLSAGDTLTISFYLDVTSIASGDNYTAARAYLAYIQSPSGGQIPATSLFSSTPTLTTFTGAGASSGFTSAPLRNAASVAGFGGATYTGLSFSENAGAATRTDTGSFLLAQATGTIRIDATAGNYRFAFEDFGSGAARTFVTGKFGPNNDASLSALTTQDAVFAIINGNASVPEPGALPFDTTALSGLLLTIYRTRKRSRKPHS